MCHLQPSRRQLTLLRLTQPSDSVILRMQPPLGDFNIRHILWSSPPSLSPACPHFWTSLLDTLTSTGFPQYINEPPHIYDGVLDLTFSDSSIPITTSVIRMFQWATFRR
eukprot:GHVN01064276.1.p1 GENE.GHVN01064276.1~~GHVN01064276.1.p1  ORF type:complete len:109 (-),score=8.11 GHVN01064276.1:455-781(-)